MSPPQDHKGRHCHPHQRTAPWPARLSSLFSLSLLLALLLVPVFHHPCLFAPAGCSHRPHPGPGGPNELHFTATGPERPHSHHHDPAACLICQAALSSHYFFVPIHFQPHPVICPGPWLCPCPPTTFHAKPCLLISNPRSPPDPHLPFHNL